MNSAHLKLILNAKTDSKASIVLERSLQAVNGEVQSLKPYHKGGFEAVVAVEVSPGVWASQVLYLISLAQTLGRAWHLSGDIREELDMTTTDLRTPGLSFAWLSFSSMDAG